MSKGIYIFCQIWLPLVGLPGMWLMAKKKKIAPLFGLLGQPAWFYCAVYTEQWGTFALNAAYAVSWIYTAKCWWLDPPKTSLK